MPPRGRPPAARGVYSFEDATLFPPTELVLDTSFVLDALLPSQPRHPACQAFLAGVAEAGSTVFFNHLLENELWEAAYRVAFRELHPGKRATDVRHDGRARRRAKRLRADVETAWRSVLDALDWVAIDVSEVADAVPDVMAWGLPSYDAVHVATALYVGVRPLVTLDYHFRLVPRGALDLYVPNYRVRGMRNARA